jgi:hypothetical protein
VGSPSSAVAVENHWVLPLWKGLGKFQMPIPSDPVLLGSVKANFDDDKRSRWYEGLGEVIGFIFELLGEVIGFLCSVLLELLNGL